MKELTMPLKSVKILIKREIELHMDNVSKVVHQYCYPDVQRKSVSIARDQLNKKLDACETLEQLEAFMSYSGYRMSVQDWIDSL